jgi:hypothetical protein
MRPRAMASLLLSVMMLGVAPAFGDTDDARSHFNRGVELFKEGDFRAALIEFQRAYDATPNYKVLYNLGQTSLELQDYAGALKAFRGYLDGGGNQIPAARRTQVEADLKKLESRVARLEILVNVEGADVTIDDVSVGRSPLREPVLVGAGRRKIVVTKAGLTAISRMIDVAGGDKPRVAIELFEPTQPTQPTLVTTAQSTKTDADNTPQPVTTAPMVTGPSAGFYVTLVVTSTLLVGTGVLGGITLVAKNNFDSKVAQVGVQTSQVDDARTQTRTFAAVTDIVGGVTIASAITMVIVALTTSSKHPKSQEHVSFVIGPGSIGIAGAL